MATIGRVVVDVDANTAKFIQGINRAIKKQKTFGTAVKNFAKIVGRTLVTAVAAAAAGLAALTIAGIKSADQLAKTASKLGIAAKELAGLRLAAEQAGVANNTLDMALQRVIRRISEAARGTGEAQGAIKELGLDAKELGRLLPHEQMRAITVAFEDVRNEGDKVRLAFKLFDSEGVAVVNMLNQGVESLDKFREEAVRLGLTLETKQLKAIEGAADAGNLMNKAFTGLGQQLAATFAPAMEKAKTVATDFVVSLTASIPKLAAYASAVHGISRAVESLTLKEVRLEFIAIERELLNAIGRLKELQATTADLANQRGFLQLGESSVLRQAAEEVARLTIRSQELQQAFKTTATETVALTTAFADLPSGFGRGRAIFELASADLDTLIAKIEEIESAAKSITAATRTPFENFAKSMAVAREALRKDLISQDTFDRFKQQWIDKIITPVDDLKEASKNSFDSIREFAIQGARDSQQAWADFFFEPFDDGVKGMVVTFLNAIRRMLANQAAQQFLGFLTGIIAPNPKGGGTKSPPPTKSGKGFAQGGSFLVPGSGGPDSQRVSFDATPNERVTITKPGQSAGGDINVYNSYTINGADPERSAELLRPAFEQNKMDTIATIVDMQARRQMR